MARVEGFEPGNSGLQPVDDSGNPIAVGVWGDSDTAMGVFGTSGTVAPGATPRGGDPAGVVGNSVQNPGMVGRSIDHMGVLGQSTNVFGVFGVSGSPTRGGVVGFNGAGGPAVSGFSEDTFAVDGSCFRTGTGVFGGNFRDSSNPPIPATGVGVSGYNEDTGSGVYGQNDGTGIGVSGRSPRGDGVQGLTVDGLGVYGLVENSGTGVGVVGIGLTGDGVRGSSQRIGVRGFGLSIGVRGDSTDGNSTGVSGVSVNGAGVSGVSPNGIGVIGVSNNFSGVLAESTAGSGVLSVSGTNAIEGFSGSDNGGGAIVGHAFPGGFAGLFVGDVHVSGSLFKAGGGFEIDHPTDPGNKYLRHSFIESPDMLNVYNGMVTTDSSGEAVVALPDYFETLNDVSGYQLTVIGKPASAFVAEEVKDNRFTIRTSVPHVKVSWQVSGGRRDPWAVDNPILVEEDKSASDRGRYLHPALYGQPVAVALRGRPRSANQPGADSADSFQRARDLLPEHIRELVGRPPTLSRKRAPATASNQRTHQNAWSNAEPPPRR